MQVPCAAAYVVDTNTGTHQRVRTPVYVTSKKKLVGLRILLVRTVDGE